MAAQLRHLCINDYFNDRSANTSQRNDESDHIDNQSYFSLILLHFMVIKTILRTVWSQLNTYQELLIHNW